jgi:ethanolamine utilization protein EutQ (cupin superfamily)
MPVLIEKPTRVEAAGTKPKTIDEFVGLVNSAEPRLSVALMNSPAGWVEPGQRPDFDEWTVVIEGALHVEHDAGVMEVKAGQGVLTKAGERVRYSTPSGARYVAICLPAFSYDLVHREEE